MKWFVGSIAVFTAVFITVFAVYKSFFQTYPYRYRLQISLSVGEKVATGSSVIEVTLSCGPKVAGLAQCAPSLAGQAPVIDLGSRGVVVATLHTGDIIFPVPDGAVDAISLCARAFGNQSTYEDMAKLPHLFGRRDLSPDNFPRLVWFSSPADPKSARKVTIENIANIIDPSARVTEAFVEITRDPIVVDIAKKLPWYPALLEAQKGKGISSVPGKFQLTYNMFVGEDTK
jgi:hypothetical protein